MKKFFRQNWLWIVSILFFTTLFLLLLFLKDNLEPWLERLLKAPFKLIAGATIIFGGFTVGMKVDDAIVEHNWQRIFLIFLLIASFCLTVKII